jgi:hypothetical protein
VSIFPDFAPPQRFPWWLRLRLWFIRGTPLPEGQIKVWRGRLYVVP